ncbi:MAG: prenyltransferase/squalene oxidase repeat-containing protein [Pirellulaceae bacterium]
MNVDAEMSSDVEMEEEVGSQRFLFFNLVPSWTVSFLTHVIILVIFALWVLHTPPEPKVTFEASTATNDSDADSLDIGDVDLDLPTLDSLEESAITETQTLSEITPTELEFSEPASMATDLSMLDASPLGAVPAGAESGGGELAARSGEGRKNAMSNGASAESEECVDLALEFLARHQLEDGSWNFDHTVGSGNRSRRNPGQLTSARAAATGLALMAFLGCGETHKEGRYRDTVQKGLHYLVETRGQKTTNGFSFFVADYGDNMYSHGICAIAICEAYAMTHDSWLKGPAQGTLDFIGYAQHPGGGWRYLPRVEPGDTSVAGWQIMAMKSGLLSGLEVDTKVLNNSKKFLDQVSIRSGAFYGYMEPPEYNNIGHHKGRTAIGLLCRMYMGWPRENPALGEGVEWLANRGPYLGSRDNPRGADMYYNYYATQVLRQWGGDDWKKWNEKMRDYLVESQDKDGAERGSWYFPSGDLGSEAGGRIYCTTMAALTLEVYYRYLPIYREEVSPEKLILD